MSLNWLRPPSSDGKEKKPVSISLVDFSRRNSTPPSLRWWSFMNSRFSCFKVFWLVKNTLKKREKTSKILKKIKKNLYDNIKILKL
ncbi:MAG: hypothetical protein GY830_09175 [Bacteroidetes bacterium]|nr:hypothetical protein [Bacteroidota bacterium]